MSSEKQTNWAYLIPLVTALTFGVSTLGFVIAGNNQVGGILSQKLEWGSDETMWNTAISSAGVSGLIIGSFAIEPLLRFIGRRKAIMLTSVMCIGSVAMTVILNIVAILVGKFLFGLASGGLIVASSLYLNETVPVEHSAAFGFTTNFGVICGIMICLLMGAALPDPVADPEAAKDNDFWMVISLFPALVGAINLVLWLCIFRLDSLKSSMSHESTQQDALDHVKKIYKAESEEEFDQIYQELLKNHRDAQSNQTKPPGYKEVLCDARYMKATWLVSAIAIFNQMSGVNLISIYSTTLFQQISESSSDGGFSISPGTGSALVGVFQFVGCLIAPLLGRCMGMRTIFIGGQFAMGLSQLAVAICVHVNGSLTTTIFILCFLTCYQATQGSFFWFYAAAVATDTANSVASMVLWACVLLMSTCSNALFNGLGQEGTFYLFSGFCFAGGILFIFTMKEINGLSKEQQQSLFRTKLEGEEIPLTAGKEGLNYQSVATDEQSRQ